MRMQFTLLNNLISSDEYALQGAGSNSQLFVTERRNRMIKKAIHSIIFFDLDGTLFDQTGQIPLEVIEQIKTMESRGILPVISSGRSPFEIENTLKVTGINSIVAMTGALVVIDGDVVYQSVIDRRTIDDLRQSINLDKTPIAFYNRHENVVSSHGDNVLATYKHIHSPIPRVDSVFYKSSEVNMMLIFSQDDEMGLQSQYSGRLQFFRNIPYAMDITAFGVSKASGLKHVMDLYPRAKTYAFGDGKNDLPMAEVVDRFVAMGNAADEVKAAASFVTTTNADRGIINGLRHYGLESDSNNGD
jgi:Cof subfamily protein (haloacid dehalogenase superfamily)